MHISIDMYNATSEIGNKKYSLLPFRDLIIKISTCRKCLFYGMYSKESIQFKVHIYI